MCSYIIIIQTSIIIHNFKKFLNLSSQNNRIFIGHFFNLLITIIIPFFTLFNYLQNYISLFDFLNFLDIFYILNYFHENPLLSYIFYYYYYFILLFYPSYSF